MNFAELTTTWQHLNELAPEAAMPITDSESLARVTAFLQSLDRTIGETPDHALAPLAGLVMERILAYEATHFKVDPVDGVTMLAFFMEQRGLTQLELAAATSLSQAVISRLLRGEREFTAKHARLLGEHFQIEPGLFLQKSSTSAATSS